ncbi:hypothetical protein [Aeoliella sp.]|uniref:hypothetical protein n=1 Tax=Aeoliella sp. TaxID=2795800 RepID=UPI003CCC0676
MKSPTCFANAAGWALSLAILPAVLGCSDGKPERVPVSGTVLIDGEPLTYGFIKVIPTDGRSAYGRLDAEGRFELTTYEVGDGALLGTHPVEILAEEPLSDTKSKWHAPKKYASHQTSELTVDIDGPVDDLTLELTWDGGKPFVEHVQ